MGLAQFARFEHFSVQHPCKLLCNSLKTLEKEYQLFYTHCMEKLYFAMFLLAVMMIALGIIAVILKKLSPSRKSYKSKGPYLLSNDERNFFDALSQAIPPGIYVCPKVRIADLLEVNIPKSERSFWTAFNQIAKKHVDFVLCTRTNFAPQLVIELDGGSHNTRSRSERDDFVDSAFEQANIPILHIKSSSAYDINVITSQIQVALSAESSAPSSVK